MAAYEVLLLNTAIPQIQAAQAGDTYVVPRAIAINATAIISADSATDALRITQIGAGNAILVEDSANPDSTPFAVTAAGDVGIGTDSPGYKLQVSGTSGQTFSIERVASSIGSSTSLGTIVGTGEIPTLTADGASIQFVGAGTWSATSAPGRIVFNTTPAATTTPVERFQLAAGEAVFNDTSNDYDFRVESDNNTHMLFVDAGNDRVGIGTSAPNTNVEISTTVDPILRLNNSTNTVTNGADIGEIQFYTNDASTSGTGVKAFVKTVAQAFGANQGGADLVFGTAAYAVGDASEKMRIDKDGNVGIGTSSPNASAILDAQSTTKGVRMPNMTTTQKNAIASPAAGLIVFDTTLAKLCVYSGAAWETITSV